MFTVRRALLGSLVLGHCSFLGAADIDAAKAGTGTNGFKPLVKDDRPATPTLAPASNEGEVRIKQFKLTPGLKVDLWAAEPMLANPVAFSVDEKGRVFTSETYRYRTSVLDIRHYMFMLEDDLASRSIEDRLAQIRKWFGPEGEKALSNETEVIRLLEDTNGDHKADKSSIFADGFTSPLSGIASGVLARNGEVWFTEIPSLWRFKPQAGEKDSVSPPPTGSLSHLQSRPRLNLTNYTAEALLTGFGVRFSFTGHDLHGLKFGPDGRLYFSCGDRGAHIVTQEGTVIDLPDEGAVFRCEPDGSNLEVVHRGLRNPQELVFNEYGDLFTGDNDSDQGDRERWVQIVEGGDSGWRVGHQHAPLGNAGMWNMERLWVPHFEGQAAYLIPPIANISDGPSGVVYDYGTSLPEELKGRFLLAYFKGTSAKSGLYSLKLRPAGASYELVAHDEFVWNSLVPDVDLTPDGAILFADWHEGWPKSNKGRLYRAYFPGVIADPVVQETAKLLGEGFAKRSEKELLSLLAHRDMRVRQEAQFELAARGPKSFDGLKKVAMESKNQLARIHALWGIGQVLRKASPNVLADEVFELTKLWVDSDQEVLGQALLALGDAQVADMFAPLPRRMALLNDRQLKQAYVGLGRAWKSGGDFRSWKKTAAGKGWDALPDRLKQSSWQLSNQLGIRLWEEGPPNPDWPGLTYLETNSAPAPELLTAIVEASLRAAAGFQEFIWRQDHPSKAVRLAIILALRKHGGELAEIPATTPGVATKSVVISHYLSDPNPLLVLEAARAINDVPITNALPALAALAEPAKLDALLKQFAAMKPAPAPALAPGAISDVRADQPLPWTNAPMDHLTPMLLRIVNANFRVGTPESAQRLASLATRTDLSDLIRTEALYALFHWVKPPARDRVVGVFRPLPERRDASANEALRGMIAELLDVSRTREAVVLATCRSLNDRRILEAAPHLEALVRNDKAPATVRAAALRPWVRISKLTAAVSSQSDAMKRFQQQADELLRYAAAQTHEVLRLESSRLSAELNPDDAVGQLAAKLTSGSLAEQQSAFASLGDLRSDAADAILAEWLDKLMKREVANEVMLDLVEAAAKRDAGAVKSRLETYAKWKLPQDHLTPYREALFGGDAARGRKIFYENPAVACTRCHHIGNDGGGNAGPVLDGLASRVTREHLLESIVFPNQQVTQGFETAMISLKNGTAYAGIVKAETDGELTLISPEDGELKLKKADITSRDTGLSGMPEGFGQLLSRQELRDVIEFLGTLK